MEWTSCSTVSSCHLTPRTSPHCSHLGRRTVSLRRHGAVADLDADDDDRFEMKELSNMLVTLGLDSKHTVGAPVRQQPWNWNDALQKMDGNGNGLLSKLEVINHMHRLGMSKRQVADWLKYSVGLPAYITTFAENSVTGYDLPAILEDGGDEILREELGITSALHRKQIRRAILNRMFGFAPLKPEGLSCVPGKEPGSIVVSWEENDEDDEDVEDDLIYRLRRQGRRTKEWVTVTAGEAMVFHDSGLPAGLQTAYKLDAWNSNGVSDEVKLTGCVAKAGFWTSIDSSWAQLWDVLQLSLLDNVVLLGLLSAMFVPSLYRRYAGDGYDEVVEEKKIAGPRLAAAGESDGVGGGDGAAEFGNGGEIVTPRAKAAATVAAAQGARVGAAGIRAGGGLGPGWQSGAVPRASSDGVTMLNSFVGSDGSSLQSVKSVPDGGLGAGNGGAHAVTATTTRSRSFGEYAELRLRLNSTGAAAPPMHPKPMDTSGRNSEPPAVTKLKDQYSVNSVVKRAAKTWRKKTSKGSKLAKDKER